MAGLEQARAQNTLFVAGKLNPYKRLNHESHGSYQGHWVDFPRESGFVEHALKSEGLISKASDCRRFN